MTAFASINFRCPKCGALFALNEKVASRKIQCPCGWVFTAPAIPEMVPDLEPYDVETKRVKPAEQSVSAAVAESIVSARGDLYPHRRISSFAEDDSEAEFSLARDRVIPVALLLAGLALRFGGMPFDRTLDHTNLAAALAVVVFQIVLAVALMLAGVLIASKILAANFGPVGTAVLKLTGMSVFSWAVGAVVVVALQYSIRAFIIAMHVIFIIYSVTFWTLFSLDLQEAIFTVAICALLQNAAAFVIFTAGK